MKKKVLLLIATLFTCSAFTLGAAACDLTLLGNSSSEESSSSEEKISEGLSYELLDNDTYAVVGMGDCEDTDIFIPNLYNDKAVTSIGENAFAYYTALTSITIRENVTTIGNSAFEDCNGIKSVTIGENVTAIGSSAFLGCSSLTEIVIPESVTAIKEETFKDCTDLECVTINGSITSIGASAFLDCENLEKITIPKSVTSVGENAFNGCDSLTGVYISSVEAWCKISFDNSKANPLVYAGDLYLNDALITELEIPESITSIGNYAFEDCKSLTSITLPVSITSIGERAFSGLRSLTSIIIPSDVASIGDRAFFGSDSLTIYCEAESQPNSWNAKWNFHSWNDSTLPVVWDCKNNDVATDGYIYTVLEGIRYALKDGEAKVATQSIGLKTIILLESLSYKGKQYPITSISKYAFSDCENLEYNEYGNAKYLGSATNDYFALVEANMNAFEYSMHSDTKLIADSAFQSCHKLTNLVIPDGVIYIGDYAFYHCDRLWDLTIPESVKVIGKYAFYLCSLGKLTIPDGVTTIKEYAFYYCGNLTNVTIGNDVTSIGDYAFLDCEELTSVTIGSGVVSIGDYAFSGCARLTNLAIGASVASIGKGAFYRCIELTSIIIPDGVTSIGKEAFYLSYKVTSLVIPESVTSIGDSAFYGCGETTNVYYGGSAEAWANLQMSSQNTYLTSATIYYYIEKEEDVPTDGGKYWHYDENEDPVAW